MKNRFKTIYANVIFYLLLILYFLVSIPPFIVITTLLAICSSRRGAMRRIRVAIGWWGLITVKAILFPVAKVLYKDSSDGNVSGPYIFVCNHKSSSDPVLVALPCMPVEGVQVVNIWPFRIPLFGAIAKLAGYLSVREMPFEEFLRKATGLMKQGVSIVAFPEGVRSGEKAMGPFHSSIFRVALQTHCPIVPICITGNERIPARGSFLMQPGTIRLHKLPAIQWQNYKSLTPFLLKNKVRDIIANELSIMESKTCS